MVSYMLLSFSYYPASIHENVINNECNFNILHFKKHQVKCFDHGINKKYCNTYSIPNDFVILKEYGLDYNENINIYPNGIYKYYNSGANSIKLAHFYYSFNCDNITKEAKLLLTILPTFGNDKTFSEELVDICYMISFALSIYIFLKFLVL